MTTLEATTLEATTLEAAAGDGAPPDRVEAFAKAVRMLAAQERRGDLAALRRLDCTRPFAPAFFTLLAAHAPEVNELAAVQRYACFVQILALKPDALTARRLGEVLAQTFGTSIEGRVQKLLSAGGDALLDQARLIARRLAGEGVLAYRDLGRLLLARDEERRDAVRLAIARDYWRTLDKAGRSSGETEPAPSLSSDPETV